MKKQEASVNHTNYKHAKNLKFLLKKAKLHNRLNQILQETLPPQLKGITLCLIEEEKVTFVAKSSALAFRIEKQKNALLRIVNELEELSHIKFVSIKVDKIN